MDFVSDFYASVMDADSRIRLADLIKKARGSRSQRQFSKALGVSYATVRSWEECESLPNLESLETIASTLDLSLEELLALIRSETEYKPKTRPKVAEDVLPIIGQMDRSEAIRLTQMMVEWLAKPQ